MLHHILRTSLSLSRHYGGVLRGKHAISRLQRFSTSSEPFPRSDPSDLEEQMSNLSLARFGQLPMDRHLPRHFTAMDLVKFYHWRDVSKMRLAFMLFTAAGLLTLLLWDKIKGFFGEQGAEVATRTIADQRLQKQAEELSSAVVKQLLSNVELRATATLFLMDLAAEENTQTAVVNLLSSVVKTERAQSSLSYLGQELLKLPEIQAKAADLARVVVHDILDDDEIKLHAKQFLRDVFSDETVQSTAGSGLWNAVKWGVIPRWLGGGKPALANEASTQTVAPNPLVVHQTTFAAESPSIHPSTSRGEA